MSSCVIMAKHLRESFSSICINRSKAKQPKLDSPSDPIISWTGKYSHPILASLHHQCLVLVINSREVFLPTTLQVVRASIYKPIMKTPVESQDIALAVFNSTASDNIVQLLFNSSLLRFEQTQTITSATVAVVTRAIQDTTTANISAVTAAEK